MSRHHVAGIALALVLLASPAAADQRLSFADAPAGSLPQDFVTALLELFDLEPRLAYRGW